MGNKENFTNRMYVDRNSSGASPCVHVTEQHMTGVRGGVRGDWVACNEDSRKQHVTHSV